MYSTGRLRLMKRATTMILLAGLAWCSSAAAGDVLEIGGTGSALGTMKLLGAAFEKIHPRARVHVMPSVGSSGAIKAVAKNALDIGLVSRPLGKDEQKPDLAVTAYAKTPFVLVSRDDVPVSGLTTGELVRIYRGELQTWKNGERIRPILRPATETDTLLAGEISPEMSAAMDAARSRPGLLTALTDQDSTDMLEKTPGSLGFSTLTQVVAEKHRLKILTLNGLAPSAEALAAGTYPFSKTLSLVTRKTPPKKVRQFIVFIRSAQGMKILRDSGNVPVTEAGAR